MSFTRLSKERLLPTLRRIEEVLEGNVEELPKFESWAVSVLESLTRAAGEGRGPLMLQVTLIRQELAELQRDITIGFSATGRTELRRMCKREWLTSIVEVIDEVWDFADPSDRLAA